MMPTTVEAFFESGCGRCKLGGTPQCKAMQWTGAMMELRRILLDCMLEESVKWGFPTYSWKGKNVANIGAMKEFCCIGFFKGSLLHDEHNILVSPGENSQAIRYFPVTSAEEVLGLENEIKAYILEAIELEVKGVKVAFKKAEDYDIPEEFENRMNNDAELKAAFDALTPGRKKGYLLHFAAAKQSATREARIDKYRSWILDGKGMHD